MFNKTYSNEIEEKKRQQIFLQNQEIVEAHNKLENQGLETYSLAINEYSDWTYDEHLEVIGMDLSKAVNEKFVNSSLGDPSRETRSEQLTKN